MGQSHNQGRVQGDGLGRGLVGTARLTVCPFIGVSCTLFVLLSIPPLPMPKKAGKHSFSDGRRVGDSPCSIGLQIVAAPSLSQGGFWRADSRRFGSAHSHGPVRTTSWFGGFTFQTAARRLNRAQTSRQ